MNINLVMCMIWSHYLLHFICLTTADIYTFHKLTYLNFKLNYNNYNNNNDNNNILVESKDTVNTQVTKLTLRCQTN